jgi:hypothetical protein
MLTYDSESVHANIRLVIESVISIFDPYPGLGRGLFVVRTGFEPAILPPLFHHLTNYNSNISTFL